MIHIQTSVWWRDVKSCFSYLLKVTWNNSTFPLDILITLWVMTAPLPEDGETLKEKAMRVISFLRSLVILTECIWARCPFIPKHLLQLTDSPLFHHLSDKQLQLRPTNIDSVRENGPARTRSIVCLPVCLFGLFIMLMQLILFRLIQRWVLENDWWLNLCLGEGCEKQDVRFVVVDTWTQGRWLRFEVEYVCRTCTRRQDPRHITYKHSGFPEHIPAWRWHSWLMKWIFHQWFYNLRHVFSDMLS